jgi:hypothetical protein
MVRIFHNPSMDVGWPRPASDRASRLHWLPCRDGICSDLRFLEIVFGFCRDVCIIGYTHERTDTEYLQMIGSWKKLEHVARQDPRKGLLNGMHVSKGPNKLRVAMGTRNACIGPWANLLRRFRVYRSLGPVQLKAQRLSEEQLRVYGSRGLLGAGNSSLSPPHLLFLLHHQAAPAQFN